MIIISLRVFKKMSFRLSHVLIIACLHFKDIHGQRRIKDGFNVTEGKQYMVYLVQTKSAIRKYNGWICGGSIVNRWYILTSAACVEDVQWMYAISGLRKYVSSSNIFKNNCTRRTKKKIVFTCVPQEYIFNFSKVEDWSFNDIAVVRVETPFDYKIELYEKYCDFTPSNIMINYEVQNEQVGTDVIVLGFGHKKFWRRPHVSEDLNTRMQYSSSNILELNECKSMYKSPNIINNIQKYMICTNGSGSIDEWGMPLNKSFLPIRRTNHEPILKEQSEGKNNNLTFNLNTRRHGICQNDHGGPLVAWINGEETVMGVASVFQVNKQGLCTGPYLFTSTARNKIFIDCIMNENLPKRRNICNQPPSKIGFSIARRYILWKENEEHVEDNEEIRIRPQINMNLIREG